VSVGFVAAALIKELQKPADQRTWHGFVASLVPYDFRVPTPDRLKDRLWNPDGPILSPHVFGVGWTLNAGRIISEIKNTPRHYQ